MKGSENMKIYDMAAMQLYKFTDQEKYITQYNPPNITIFSSVISGLSETNTLHTIVIPP